MAVDSCKRAAPGGLVTPFLSPERGLSRRRYLQPVAEAGLRQEVSGSIRLGLSSHCERLRWGEPTVDSSIVSPWPVKTRLAVLCKEHGHP